MVEDFETILEIAETSMQFLCNGDSSSTYPYNCEFTCSAVMRAGKLLNLPDLQVEYLRFTLTRYCNGWFCYSTTLQQLGILPFQPEAFQVQQHRHMLLSQVIERIKLAITAGHDVESHLFLSDAEFKDLEAYKTRISTVDRCSYVPDRCKTPSQ